MLVWYIRFSWSVRIHPTTKDRGLSPAILVKPVYDVSYICEKATIIIRAANQIIDATNKPQTTNVRSDYVGGILDIERALNGLHIKCREIMRVCKENESDYGLRHLGEIKFGE